MAKTETKNHDEKVVTDDEISAFAVKFGVPGQQVRELIKLHGSNRAKLVEKAKGLWIRGITS
jgi:hypothetical protein